MGAFSCMSHQQLMYDRLKTWRGMKEHSRSESATKGSHLSLKMTSGSQVARRPLLVALNSLRLNVIEG